MTKPKAAPAAAPSPEFQCQVGALRAALRQALPIIARRNKVPILAHVLLSATDGRLTITATDMEARLAVPVTGHSDLPALTVSAHRLSRLLGHAAAEDTVTLRRLDAGQLNVTCGPVNAKLFVLPAADFPDRPGQYVAKEPVRVTLRADELRGLLGRPAHAISTEETRYYLNGVYLHRADDELRACATDGHRLFLASMPFPAEADRAMPGVIVPRNAVAWLRSELARMVPEQAVTIEVRDLSINIVTRGWSFFSKTIDGTYPDYTRVIPRDSEAPPIRVDQPKALLGLIGAAVSVSQERSRPVKLSNGSGSTIVLTGRDVDEGECDVTVPEDVARWASNEPHPEAGYQARYLSDMCRAFPAGFTMRVDQTGPCICIGDEGIGVLMPMRV